MKRPAETFVSDCKKMKEQNNHKDETISLSSSSQTDIGLENAKLVSACDSATITELGGVLRGGGLVAFPTETVYGLGANGLDAKAVLKIFEAKGRPLNDPCILHVAFAEAAIGLLKLNDREKTVFNVLTKACWPGPLSIVARAQTVVPAEVTAHSEFVAVRCPSHPLARELIGAAAVPVAAPSANRFGHISPTTADHVRGDLGHVKGLQILDGGPCEVGIESTVAKLDLPQLLILRKGGTTKERLQGVLADAFAVGILQELVTVEYHDQLPVNAELGTKRRENSGLVQQPLESPGLMLKHYAPAVPTILISLGTSGSTLSVQEREVLSARPAHSILVDFRRRLQSVETKFLRTFHLCDQAAVNVAAAACTNVFAVLRAAEDFALSHRADLICISDFDPADLGGYGEALHNRLLRAASGRRAIFCTAEGPHFIANS